MGKTCTNQTTLVWHAPVCDGLAWCLPVRAPASGTYRFIPFRAVLYTDAGRFRADQLTPPAPSAEDVQTGPWRRQQATSGHLQTSVRAKTVGWVWFVHPKTGTWGPIMLPHTRPVMLPAHTLPGQVIWSGQVKWLQAVARSEALSDQIYQSSRVTKYENFAQF